MSPVVVGIAGGTASGKTSIARAVAERLGRRCVLVAHDRYYHSAPPVTRPDETEPRNFDHPDSLDTDHLIADLRRLREGRSTALPIYDFARHLRLPNTSWDRIEPRPIVLVEGILVLAIDRLRDELDHRVFVDTPDDLRLVRRIRRDLAERGRAVHDVLDQYERSVRPMHDRFVAPSRRHAELVLDGTQPLEGAVTTLLASLDAFPASRSAARQPTPRGW